MDYAAAFMDQNRAFAELIRSADPSTPVPTCPGWTITQLFRHVGRGDRWAAQLVRDHVDHYLDPRSVEGAKAPSDADGVAGWLLGGAQLVIDAVEGVGADTPVWTFFGPQPAKWWTRRRLHEVSVHWADAALALGVDCQLDPGLAADGISEWLEFVAGRAGADGEALLLGDGQSVHLHATDPSLGEAGEWTIAGGPDGITVTRRHGKGTLALRGSASDLMLAVMRRQSVVDSGIEMFGDTSLWQAWLDRTPF